jgi:hypothetical protein
LPIATQAIFSGDADARLGCVKQLAMSWLTGPTCDSITKELALLPACELWQKTLVDKPPKSIARIASGIDGFFFINAGFYYVIK